MLDTAETSAVRFHSINEGFAFTDRVNSIRNRAVSSINRKRQNSLGQFFTPLPIASWMSALFKTDRKTLRLLDAGAGTGVLTAALSTRRAERKINLKTLRRPFMNSTKI